MNVWNKGRQIWDLNKVDPHSNTSFAYSMHYKWRNTEIWFRLGSLYLVCRIIMKSLFNWVSLTLIMKRKDVHAQKLWRQEFLQKQTWWMALRVNHADKHRFSSFLKGTVLNILFWSVIFNNKEEVVVEPHSPIIKRQTKWPGIHHLHPRSWKKTDRPTFFSSVSYPFCLIQMKLHLFGRIQCYSLNLQCFWH